MIKPKIVKDKVKRPSIPSNTKAMLWLISAGRCEFKNCNNQLHIDNINKSYKKYGYIAHIYGFAEGSERFDSKLSPMLEKCISNLMLLCDECHRRIDEKIIGSKNYSADTLIKMKKIHEERIEKVTAIAPNMDSHVVIYKANIGDNSPVVTYESIREYIIPDYYPAQNRAIDLSLSGSYFRDKNYSFWNAELENLQAHYDRDLLPLLSNKEIHHISLFAMAPIPLLVKLGVLLNDINRLEVHQPIRNPKTWILNNVDVLTEYKVIAPDKKYPLVALNISLSGIINNDRITNVLGENCSIYTLTIDDPFNDFLQSKKQLIDFTIAIRKLFNKIKSEYSSNIPLHIFPAMPIATAIELGRYWMPKADMPMVIYDENRINEGFKKAIEIN